MACEFFYVFLPVLMQLSEVCDCVLSSLQASSRMEHSASRPQAALHAVAQFAESHSKMEERLSLCEQELEQVKNALATRTTGYWTFL